MFGFAGVAEGYMKAGRTRDAVRAYERAVQLDPDSSDLQAKLAAARSRMTP